MYAYLNPATNSKHNLHKFSLISFTVFQGTVTLQNIVNTFNKQIKRQNVREGTQNVTSS